MKFIFHLYGRQQSSINGVIRPTIVHLEAAKTLGKFLNSATDENKIHAIIVTVNYFC